MYDLSIKPEADKIFRKLEKKDKNLLKIINKKILEIRQNPYHTYKFLRKPLQNFNRVHINSHFVLIFCIDHASRLVDIYYFAHHDKAYKWIYVSKMQELWDNDEDEVWEKV
jgi:mRNA-degrading endonuclease RelE of RelBE toxin-antitoxin system